MLVNTSRFGGIETSKEEIIVFPNGLIGFESLRHWVIVSDPTNEDVAWLQSINDARTALPVISPRKYSQGFKVTLSKRQLVPIGIRKTDRVYVLAVVSKSGKQLTMNLRSPIVVNLTKRLACQVISSDALAIAQPIALDTNHSNQRRAA